MPAIKRLTDLAVQRLRSPRSGQIDYWDATEPGFGVRVSHSGRRSFVLMVRVRGSDRLRRFTLGRYPALSLADARNKAVHYRQIAEAGLDPAEEEEKRVVAEAIASIDRLAKSFDTMADRFLAARKGQLRPSTWNEYSRVLKGADVADLTDKSIDEVTRSDIASVLDRIDRRGKAAASNHALYYMRRFFNWCVINDILQQAPTDRIRARHAEKSRDRFLSIAELSLVLDALGADEALRVLYGLEGLPSLSNAMRDTTRLMILTGQRKTEITDMHRSELNDLNGDDPRWELPGTRTKNGRSHIVPLAPQVAAILRQRLDTCEAGGYLFGSTGEAPPSSSTIRRAKLNLDARIKAIAEARGLPVPSHWTWHDLRRTLATQLNELGIAEPHVIEAVENHLSGSAKIGVAGTYNRALYLSQRRQALTAWADYVDGLAAAVD